MKEVIRMPKSFGLVGFMDVVFFTVLNCVCIRFCTDPWIKLIVGGLFLACIVLGIYLTLFGFVRKFTLKDDEILYTNLLGGTQSFAYSDVTAIIQKKSGDFLLYVDGEKACVLDQQYPKLYMTIAERMPQSAIFETKAQRQESEVKEGVIVSKTGKVGYSISGISLIISGMLLFLLRIYYGYYSILAIIYFAFSMIYVLYCLCYQLTIDQRRHVLAIRKFGKTKEYPLKGIRIEPGENSMVGPTYFALYTGKKKLAKVDTSITVTNRELLMKILLKYM